MPDVELIQIRMMIYLDHSPTGIILLLQIFLATPYRAMHLLQLVLRICPQMFRPIGRGILVMVVSSNVKNPVHTYHFAWQIFGITDRREWVWWKFDYKNGLCDSKSRLVRTGG